MTTNIVDARQPYVDTSWVADAACREQDWVRFFPKRGDYVGPSDQERMRQSKQHCIDHCPVRESCLQYALDHGITHGVWGGTLPDERRKLMRWRERPWECVICSKVVMARKERFTCSEVCKSTRRRLLGG